VFINRVSFNLSKVYMLTKFILTEIYFEIEVAHPSKGAG